MDCLMVDLLALFCNIAVLWDVVIVCVCLVDLARHRWPMRRIRLGRLDRCSKCKLEMRAAALGKAVASTSTYTLRQVRIVSQVMSRWLVFLCICSV